MSLTRKLSFSLEEAEAGLVPERKDFNPTIPCDAKYILIICFKFILWACLYAIFIQLEFGVVYFIISMIILIYYSTSVHKKTGFSAYSVFNPKTEQLKGSIDVKNSYLLAY